MAPQQRSTAPRERTDPTALRSFPANLEHPDQLAEIVATITDLRQHTTAPYDFAVGLPPGTDPAPYAKAGATWWLVEFPWDTMSVDRVRGVLRDGPGAA